MPLLFLRHGSLQTAVDSTTDMLRDSVAALEISSDRLISRYSYDQGLKEKLARFAEACKYACTGNLNWRYAFAHGAPVTRILIRIIV